MISVYPVPTGWVSRSHGDTIRVDGRHTDKHGDQHEDTTCGDGQHTDQRSNASHPGQKVRHSRKPGRKLANPVELSSVFDLVCKFDRVCSLDDAFNRGSSERACLIWVASPHVYFPRVNVNPNTVGRCIYVSVSVYICIYRYRHLSSIYIGSQVDR